jgi:hypothetical protein
MKKSDLDPTCAPDTRDTPGQPCSPKRDFISKLVSGRFPLVRNFCLIALVFAIAGCGGPGVDFFPSFHRQPTTPDDFSFADKTGVLLNTTVTSDPITVSGLTAATSPVSISGSVGSNSTYSINGATATDVAGAVKNGDKVTVSHTSANVLGAPTSSDLTIGNVTGTFISITQTVAAPVFAAVTAAPGLPVVSAGVTILAAPGNHQISIQDNLNSSNAVYSLDNVSNFTNLTQTIPLSGRTIFLRNIASNTSGAVVTTTLTIDGVTSTFTITTQ